MSNDAHHSLTGRTLGNRYVVERLLGKGGMGTVYCARQVNVGTLVAIKVLHPPVARDPSLVERFEREAFAMARLDHPNALRVLDFGKEGELLYLVTEYVEAKNLSTIMEAEWPVDDQRIIAILSQVLGALIAVHEIGIVHRDIKPENILVLVGKNDDGEKVDVVKICDFGIAKVSGQTLRSSRSFVPRLTAEGVVVGTPEYMSPEQARGHTVDGRSDLYSVGVVLYHLLAGQTPLNADTPLRMALQHLSEAPIPPSHYRNVHPALEAVCLRALSKRPEDRFQTARDMRNALRNALTTCSMAAPEPTSFLAVKNTRRRTQLAVGYAVVSFAAITASAFVASRRSNAMEMAAQVHAAIALVSPPSLATVPMLSVTPDTTAAGAEPATTIDQPLPAPLTIEPIRRLVTRRRQQPATSSPARRLLVAAPPPSPISPASLSPIFLIRGELWPNRANVPQTARGVPRLH
jgi:eukaryotic-like serine/threonine-protein kinase